MKRWVLFVLVVAPLVYLLMFGLSRNPRELPSVLIGKPSPSFSLQTLEGETVTLESLRGSPLVINFWATWCTPCVYEHAVLAQGRERFEPEGVKFLGVVYLDRPEAVRSYIKEMGEPFLVLLDENSRAAIDFGVGGVPETYFIDAEGVVRKKLAGVLSGAYLEKAIEELGERKK